MSLVRVYPKRCEQSTFIGFEPFQRKILKSEIAVGNYALVINSNAIEGIWLKRKIN